jgi:hypothetical protein
MSTTFDEIIFDGSLITAQSATASPEFANTLIRNSATGVYKVNITRYDPQLMLTLDLRQISPEELEYFNNFWYGGWGSAYGFRLHWSGDFYAIDEVIGLGDGGTVVFPIYKSYVRPGSSTPYVRRIIKPVTNTTTGGSSVTLYEADGTTSRVIPSIEGAALGVPAFTVKVNSVATSAYTVDNVQGIITLTKKTFTADFGTDFITSTAHGFSNGNAIKVENTGGGLPAPLVTNTLYYVRDKTTDTFKLAATLGGAAIDLTTDGTGTQKISGPPVNFPVSWSGEFDTPVRFLANNYQGRVDLSSEISGIQLCEILPSELGIS